MVEKWYLTCKKVDFDELGKHMNVDPLLIRILANRDLLKEEDMNKFLFGTMKDVHAPSLLKDMDKAVSLIREAIIKKKKIRIIGDYDVDGICSGYILKKGLTYAGGEVDVVIPHRMKDGYGLNVDLIQQAIQDGIQVLITCDNGISAMEAIHQAKEAGITVVVTDHHEVVRDESGTQMLPCADAVVDPKQDGCFYPFKEICGAFVAYKLIDSLLGLNGNALNYKDNGPVVLNEELIQAAAMATVCDVMPLLDENRILVKRGLELLRSRPIKGIEALMMENNLEREALSSYHIGFILGPCLNASGRLDAATKGLELMLCENANEASRRAFELKELNEERKQMTLSGVTDGEKYIEEHNLNQDKVLVIFLPDCHESLAGIIAGRIREKYEKPVLVVTRGAEGLKGSARSIDAYSIYEGLCGCKEYLTKFGGHRLAAGFSLEEDNLKIFRQTINAQCTLTDEDFVRKVKIDAAMPFSYATVNLVKQLECLEPFGVSNPKPLFARKNVILLKAMRFGQVKQYAKYTVLDEDNKEVELTLFSQVEEFESFLKNRFGETSFLNLYKCSYGNKKPEESIRISVAYQVGINRYQGRESVQFFLKNYCV